MSALLQGFNVTIYGMGLVFLALLVLMVATMLLAKLFAVTTGTERSVAASKGGADEALPTAGGAEKAPASQASPPPPSAGSAWVRPTTLTLSVGGQQHKAEVAAGNGASATVRLGGSSYEVQRDPADRKRILVNGQAHTVEIQESSASSATVVVDGLPQKVQIAREVAATPAAAAPVPPAPAPAQPQAPSAAGERVIAPLPGKVLSIAVKVGDRVKQGDELCVIEAMKMANSIKAPRAGTVAEVLASAGQTVAFGVPLIVLN